MMSAPAASATFAPSAIQWVSQPASWTTCVPTPAVSQRRSDIGLPYTSASLAVISETTSPAPSVAASRRKGASVTQDIGARRTRLAAAISPLFNGLEREISGPVTSFSWLGRRLHCNRQRILCAQILGSQASCLHFRQLYHLCKCTATKTAFPTGDGNHSIFRIRHGRAVRQRARPLSTPIRSLFECRCPNLS